MRFWLAVLAAAVIALVTVSMAFAHAAPKTVSPGDGAVLSKAPTSVVIETVEDMARVAGANDLQVFDASGKQVTTAPAVIKDSDRSNISVALPTDLAVGTYTVKWKTLSADDGDAANGTLSFTYDPSKPSSPGKVDLIAPLAASPAATSSATAATTSPSPTATATGATATVGPANSLGNSTPGSTPWVLVAAVGVGMLALGSGGTFLLINKKEA
jgi:copper resistance protein C